MLGLKYLSLAEERWSRMSTPVQAARAVSVQHLAPKEKIAPPGGAERMALEADSPGAGATDVAFLPGDFILTHGNEWTSKLIRFGQRLRFRGPDKKYTYWNHTALIVDQDGSIVEALGAGVQQRNISVYEETQRTLVRIESSPEDREQARRFALWAKGSNYGFLTILSIAYSLLTGGKFGFYFKGQHICSGLVSRALERTGLIFESEPSHIMPAELAKLYDIAPPSPSMEVGRIPSKKAR